MKNKNSRYLKLTDRILRYIWLRIRKYERCIRDTFTCIWKLSLFVKR